MTKISTNTIQTWKPSEVSLKDAYYIVGFSDGEGSFNISFRKREDHLIGWKIAPVFNISQKELLPLTFIKKHLKCGTIRSRNDGVWVYEVNNKIALETHIIPFFEHFPSISDQKKIALRSLKNILLLLKECLGIPNDSEFKQILALRNHAHANMSKRTYTDQELLDRFHAFSLKNKDKIDAKIKGSSTLTL